MDTITVVIQLTGLLMVVPPRAGGPTHVLVPVTPDTVPHETFIGFRSNGTARHCDPRFGEAFCFVDMEGWALDPIGGANNGSVTLPRGVVNLTRGSGGYRVKEQHLGQGPHTELRSRFTLRGGGVTDACNLGVWSYNPAGPAPAVDLPLTNVLEWTIPDLRQSQIVLVRRSLTVAGTTPDTLAILSPDSTGAVELLIANVPPAGLRMLQRELRRSTAAQEVPSGQQREARDGEQGDPEQAEASETMASHVTHLYDLLTQAPERPVPVFRAELIRRCPLPIWREHRLRSPTTVNCMVVSGSY
jgi:hypothetical protein